jgi:PAS domain S-box-containing protein
MRQPKIEPVDSARNFELAELFFSTTDRRGIIEAGNAVFARIAGYPMDQLVGSPHNIIRHPDMPRAVFQLLWDHVLGGRTIAAYVKNLASDGRYYWVVALVIPIGDRFLSVRFKPTSPLFGAVRQLYAEMLQIEAATVADGGDGAASMAAAAARLQSALADLGHADYDAFMRAALRDELKHRDTLLTAQIGRVHV